MIEFDSIKMVTEETFVDVSTENKNKSYNKIPSYKVKGCLKDTIAKIDNL